MYFWKIDQLKSDLSRGPLPQSEQFKYLFTSSILFGLTAVPFLSNNRFDVLIGVLNIVVIGAGTYYIYHCNGGQSGEQLLERYISLTLVMFFRFFVLVLLPVFTAFYVIRFGIMGIPEDTSTEISDVILTFVLGLVFCFLVGRHIRDVANVQGRER